MNHKKTNNPETVPTIIPYAIYNNHKVARKQIQTQREQAQHTISYLQRQAKRTSRDLQSKEKHLLNYYKLKESRFEDAQQKQKQRRQREIKLQEMRKTNNLFRESSSAKRQLVRNNWSTLNKKSAQHIKSERSESQKKLQSEKQLEQSLLRRRNQAFSRALALGTEHSRAKSMYSKRFQSSIVKHDLISIEQRIKSKELEQITALNARQQELLEIVQRNRKGRHQYETTIEEIKTLPFDQIYPKVLKESGPYKAVRSRRGSDRSDTIINSNF